MHSAIERNRDLRVVKAPHELHPFHFLIAWHPRLNSDPRHAWLREAMRSATAALNEQPNAVEDFRSDRKGATR
jgi:DNA-binding transcriptional LysR family regulator